MQETYNFDDSKIIYLFRHGETNWNVEDRVMGQLEGIETKFTNKGYKQIKEISETIKEKNVEVIYCSDFQRAYETAVIANEKLRVPIFPEKKLRGLNMGKYQGLFFEDFINRREVIESFKNYDLKIGGGESINELNARIYNFIKNIVKNTKYQRIAIITHSAVISNLRSYLSKSNYISLSECSLLYKNNKLLVTGYKCNK